MGEDISLGRIPPDCNKMIISYLPFRDIGNFMSVSRDLHTISLSNNVWNSLYYRKWPGRMNRAGYRAQEPVGSTDWLEKFKQRLTSSRPSGPEDGWQMFTEASQQPTSFIIPASGKRSSAVESAGHVCDPNKCLFSQSASNDFRCIRSGLVHVCEPCRDGFACSKSIESVNDSLWVCPISARSFQYANGLTIYQPFTKDVSSDTDSDSSCCRLDKRTKKRQRRHRQ